MPRRQRDNGPPPRATRKASLAVGAAAGIAHAILLLAAFHFPLAAPLAPLAVTPLALVALRPTRARYLAIGVLITSAIFWAWTHRWVGAVSALGLPPLVLYLALYPALFTLLAARIARRPRGPLLLAIAGGLLWTALEILRAEIVWGGYAWYLVAHPLIDYLPLARPAVFAGVYLVSALAATLAVALAMLTVRRAHRPAALTILITLALWTALALAAPRPPATERTLRVALVQTNVPTDNKTAWTLPQRIEDWRELVRLTLEAADAEPDLIAWPETMFPGSALDPESLAAERASGLAYPPAVSGLAEPLPIQAFAEELLALQQNLDIPILVGATAYEGLRFEATDQGAVRRDWDRAYNAALLIDAAAPADEFYAKLHLTPFGEVMPGISRFDWLEQRLLALGAAGMTFDLDRGTVPVVFDLPDANAPLRLGAPICFEVTAGWVTRRLVAGDDAPARRAHLLINITNDGWFADADDGRARHLQIARWRALELATPVLRSANTGISAAIDASGRIPAAANHSAPAVLPPRVAGVLVVDIAPAPADAPLTPYARGGHRLTWALLLAGILAAVPAFRPAPRPRPAPGDAKR